MDRRTNNDRTEMKLPPLHVALCLSIATVSAAVLPAPLQRYTFDAGYELVDKGLLSISLTTNGSGSFLPQDSCPPGKGECVLLNYEAGDSMRTLSGANWSQYDEMSMCWWQYVEKGGLIQNFQAIDASKNLTACLAQQEGGVGIVSSAIIVQYYWDGGDLYGNRLPGDPDLVNWYLNNWHHLCFASRAGETRAYLDGIEKYHETRSYAGLGSPEAMGQDVLMYWQHHCFSTSAAHRYDDITLFGTFLDSEQVAAIYNRRQCSAEEATHAGCSNSSTCEFDRQDATCTCFPGFRDAHSNGSECVPTCASDSDCDDNVFCNGEEKCDVISGVCSAGSPVSCDNRVFCDGVESCDERTKSCVAGAPPCAVTEWCKEGRSRCKPKQTSSWKWPGCQCDPACSEHNRRGRLKRCCVGGSFLGVGVRCNGRPWGWRRSEAEADPRQLDSSNLNASRDRGPLNKAESSLHLHATIGIIATLLLGLVAGMLALFRSRAKPAEEHTGAAGHTMSASKVLIANADRAVDIEQAKANCSEVTV